MENKGGQVMFNAEIDEGNVGKVKTSIKVLDALYTSESDFDECSEVLEDLANSFNVAKLLGMEFDKEILKHLRDNVQKALDEYNKKKADETITDFLN